MSEDAALITPGDLLAGYRVVRKLGSGSRAEVYLGHSGGEQQRTTALKVYRRSTSADSISTELQALSTVEHAHVVCLRDVAAAPRELPVLILERLELGTLAQLLSIRSGLEAGEAVTILAPLVAAVGVIHASGVAHGAISPSRVLFRETGAPVLAGFGHATVFAPNSSAVALAARADVAADQRALCALVGTVLSRVGTPTAGRLLQWMESYRHSDFPDAFADRLGEQVFGLASAMPVRFEADPYPVEPAIPARALERLPTPEPVPPLSVPSRGGQLVALARPLLDRVPSRFHHPRWAALAAGGLALLVALAVVPTSAAPAPVHPTASTSAVVERGPIVEDDPVAAFATLVTARNACLRELSILCLEKVDQPGSAALDDDVALIRSIEQGDGGTALLVVRDVVLQERMGDAALVGYDVVNGEPASALLVKGEAGWRIRSYFPE